MALLQKMITGSPWDAEDLVQETLLRAYATLPKLWQPVIPKAYLFRIATNSWLNERRKAKYAADFCNECNAAITDPDPFAAREAIELLVSHLPARQAAAILLFESFDFTAKEIGGMIGSTEGAVKALLGRARAKLQALQAAPEQKQLHANEPSGSRDKTTEAVIDAYLEAFNRRDPDAIVRLMADGVRNDIVHIAEEYGKEVVRKYSLEEWRNDPRPMHARANMLWNKEVIVVTTTIDDVVMLYDLIELEIEDGAIVMLRDYYFCQDLLRAAGSHLRTPVHFNGYSYGL